MAQLIPFYPSEIARLVLGYLQETNCPKSEEAFLAESPDIQEHYRLMQSGKPCTTNIQGKSLMEILYEYCCFKDAEKKRNGSNASEAISNASHSGPKSSNINLNASLSGLNLTNINSNAPHYGANSSFINPNPSLPASSSSNINPAASCSENWKTPQKNNADAFNRFKVHQTNQSQAAVRFTRGGNQSPRSLQTYLSTPTRAHSSRTPSRLQGVCVTTLNFNTGAERNEEHRSIHRGVFDTPKRTLYARTPVRETITAQRLCYSEPVRRRPDLAHRMVQTETINSSQVVEDNRSCQTSSESSTHQRPSESISENSHQLTSSVNSTNYSREDQPPSNNEYRNSSCRTSIKENLSNSRSLLPENRTSANTAVVNQTIVFTTQIRTNEDVESSSTPQYDIEPPPYARAPNTDSPRLILSFDRSQVSSLTTPIKDRRIWTDEFASPRRKGTIPRRRLLSESPHPKQSTTNESNFVAIHENVETIIEELMANQPFTQRLADNINKVISEDPEASNSSCYPTIQDIQNSDAVIQNILNIAEKDSLFNDMLSLLSNSRDCDDLNIQESAAETSEVVFSTAEDTQTNKDELVQASSIETIDSKQETDSSKQNDNAQEKNEQNSVNESSLQQPATFEVAPHNSESAINQNAQTASNVEVPEPMQVDSDETDLARESRSEDVLSSCMSIIQPDAESQLQSGNVEENNNASDNVNDAQSSASNVNESSTLVSTSVTENMTGLDDGTSLKPVSIGTPFQVGSQIAVSQAACSINQSISTSQAVVCYPSSSSVTNSTVSFIPSNRNVPILPATANQNFILNSNFQTSPLLQFSYSPAPGFAMQPLEGFQSKIIVVQQPCAAHSINATNWTTNNPSNDVIIPVQTVSTEPVTQSSIINSSPIKIPHDYSPSKSFLAGNVGNFVTVISEAAPPKKKAGKKQSTKTSVQPSPAKVSLSKKKKKRPPKKKPRPLFPSPKVTEPSSEIVISDNIPVLSIPDPSPNKDESMSAMEILTSITEGKNTQSPLLKAMISSARILAKKGGRLNSTHVRTLEFSSSIPAQEEGNKPKQSKILAEGDGRRSSPRLKQKTSCKSPCCSPSKSAENVNSKKREHGKSLTNEKEDVTADFVSNALEKLNARKAVSSSMSNVVLNAMQDALQAKPVKSKNQDSSAAIDLFERAGISVSPIKKTPFKVPSSRGKKVMPRDQYFPDSSSENSSESDNIPLSVIIASKSKNSPKKKMTKTSSPKHTNTEKKTDKNAENEILPSTNICSKKASDSNKDKSKRLDHNQQETSEISKEMKIIKSIQLCNIPEVTGNSKCNPIILESDEDMDMSEKGTENIISQVICSTGGKSPKEEQKKKHKKKKHSPKLTSPSKEKKLSHKKSKTKNYSASQKQNSLSETSDHLSQNEKSDSVTEKSNYEVSSESCAEEEKLCKKKSDASQKLKEKISVNEINNHPKSNKEAEVPQSKTKYCVSQNSPMKKQKNGGKGNWYISSPQKEKEVCHPSSVENNQCTSGKKRGNINELCDKLRLNAIQNSPRKEEPIKPVFKTSEKFPHDVVASKSVEESTNKQGNTATKNSLEVSANEATLEQEPLCSKTTVPVNSTENETLKLASVKVTGVEKSVINTEVRNAIILDSEANLSTKPSKVSDMPVKPNVKKRVLPPPKKRIRPVPIPSPRDGSFDPFSPFSSPAHTVCFDSTLKPKEMPLSSKSISSSEIIKPVSCLPELQSPAHIVNDESTLKLNEMPTVSRNSEINKAASCLPKLPTSGDVVGANSNLIVKETPTAFENPACSEINKAVSSSPVICSPPHIVGVDSTSKNKEIPSVSRNNANAEINKPVSSTPELNSVANSFGFVSSLNSKKKNSSPIKVGARRKYSLGKPKAMAEFYRSFLPDRESDLPISPDPISSSSCTADTFLARRNLLQTTCQTSPNKENNAVNKKSPEKKELEKVGHKRKLSSTSIKDSSDEEDFIKSPPKPETVSVAKTAPENPALIPSSQDQLKETYLSSSDEEGQIKSPVKSLIYQQKGEQTSAQAGKKRKLSTGFSPHHDTFINKDNDQIKSSETDHSLSRQRHAVEKHHQKERSPVRHPSTLHKAKPKSNLIINSKLLIPAGVKIPNKWNNSKINNYSSIISRSNDEMSSKAPRRSRPNIKVKRFKSPLKANLSFKRKNEHSTTYKTLYSERQARRLQLTNRRSPFRQSPNLNNSRSSEQHDKNGNKNSHSEKETSFSKEATTKEYSRRKHEVKSSKNYRSGSQEGESSKHMSPHESSSNRHSSRHENPVSSFKVSEKQPDHQDPSNKHREKRRISLPEKFNTVTEHLDELKSKNIQTNQKAKKNISTSKTVENFHKRASSSVFNSDERREFTGLYNNKDILSKEQLICANIKHKSSNNSTCKNVLPSVAEKSSPHIKKDEKCSTAVPKLPRSELGPLSKDRHIEWRQELQPKNPSQLDTKQNEVQKERINIDSGKILDETVCVTSRTSTDQNEIDQAVAFLTNDETPESQDPATSSQNIAGGSKVADNELDKNSEAFRAKVLQELSKVTGADFQSHDISHLMGNLMEKIKEFGLENIVNVFPPKK